MVFIYIMFFCLLCLGIVLIVKVTELNIGKLRVEKEIQWANTPKMPTFGSVKSLSVLPLIDYYTDRDELRTEPGVSYLIKADDTTILMDVGYNVNKEHPSPLIVNASKLAVDFNKLNMIFISHIHLDHIGGMKEQREKTFSLSQGIVEVPEIPVFAPDNITPSKWNPNPKVKIISDPQVLETGIASTGVIPRYLFIMGYTLEHSLVINLEGKGLVIIIGCGHQTIERLIEKVQRVFNEPIYAIIGGLHYPVKGGRVIKGPFNIQNIVGSDNPPWNGINEKQVLNGIDIIKQVNPQLVALSAHDSSDWSINQFQKAFEKHYVELKVGKEIIL